MAEAEPATSPGEFRPGVRIGVDVGRVRVGVARTDPSGILATPVETITGVMPASVDYLAGIVDELEPIEVIVGLPRSLSGIEGAAAATARAYAVALATKLDVPVRVVDERLTTVSAHSAMHASGRPGRKHRSVVDQVAAVMILQHALDIERSTLQPAGERVHPREQTPVAAEEAVTGADNPVGAAAETSQSVESQTKLGQEPDSVSTPVEPVTDPASATTPGPAAASARASSPGPTGEPAPVPSPRSSNIPKPSSMARRRATQTPHIRVETPVVDMKEDVE